MESKPQNPEFGNNPEMIIYRTHFETQLHAFLWVMSFTNCYS